MLHRNSRYGLGLLTALGMLAAFAQTSSAQIFDRDRRPDGPVFTGQRRPPEWAVGSFRGINRKYKNNMEIVITERGDVRVRTTDERGRTSRTNGTYRSGRIVVDGNDYRVEQVFRGIRLVQEDDSSNTVNLSKFSGEGGYDDPVTRPDDGNDQYYSRPPSWALGTFRGYNRKYRNDVELTIAREGRVTARLTERNGRVTNQNGSWRSSRIELGDRTYSVDRNGNGLQLTEVGDRSHRIELTRGGRPWDPNEDEGNDNSYDRPPSWLVGTFRAYNDEADSDVEMSVTREGRVTSRVTDKNGRVSTIRGSYRNSRIEQSGKRYEIDQTGRGVTLTEVGNRSNLYRYRRID